MSKFNYELHTKNRLQKAQAHKISHESIVLCIFSSGLTDKVTITCSDEKTEEFSNSNTPAATSFTHC